jgi:hypothetical protein
MGQLKNGRKQGKGMKANRNAQQKPTDFRPKPLIIEQENAIDLLLTGQSDREVAEAVGVTRWAVQGWRTSHPFFMATLAQRREEIFGAAVNRLRTLLNKALENITGAIQSGDVKSSFKLLKATRLHGFCPPAGETDVQKLAERLCLEQLAREHIPESSMDLSFLDKNPQYEERKREILEELGRGDLIS